MSIQALNPDFVLSVKYPHNNGTTTGEADRDLQQLSETLHAAGFTTQVRPDGPNLLVFAKLGPKYAQLAEDDVIKNYEYGVTTKNDTAADRARIIHQYLTGKKQVGGLEITPTQGNWSFVNVIVPVAGELDQVPIAEKARAIFTDTKLTTNSIKERFGVNVALYFEFLKFYSAWLVYLSVFGIISYLKAKKTFSLTYAFVNLVWGVLFITFWNRKQQYLVNFWGVQNSHLVEENNAKLARLNKSSDVKADTGAFRFIKQLTFVPVALGFTAVLVAYQLACFVLEIFLSEVYDGPGKIFLSLLPTILISVFVPILTIVYNLVGNAVIAWENHDNEYSRNNSVLIKTFVLNFLTSYMPLIITSFIYLPFAHLIEYHLGDIQTTISSRISHDRFYYKYLTQLKRQEEFKINQGRLSAQFYFFIVTNQVIAVILKYVLPIGIAKVIALVKSFTSSPPEVKIEDKADEKEWLAKVRKAITLPAYNVNDDFRGLAIQYGYLILFGTVWPLAPFVSLIFNILTFKLDILKLTSDHYFRPTVQQRVDSIHPWNYALFTLTWLGSVISPVVTAFYRHGSAPPKTLGQLSLDKASTNVSSAVQLIIILFAAEHGFFILYFTFAKISNLFKSQVELDNDFVENDIKLRREYYSGKVKPAIKQSENEPSLNKFPEGTIEQARGLVELKPELIPETVAGYSTSRDEEYRHSIEERTKQLKSKQAELEAAHKSSKDHLKSVSEKGDRIISSKEADGREHYSTIDNNQHVEESSCESEPLENAKQSAKDVKEETKESAKEFRENAKETGKQTQRNFEENAKETADDVNNEISSVTNSDNSKVSRKSTIKKLFKGKK